MKETITIGVKDIEISEAIKKKLDDKGFGEERVESFKKYFETDTPMLKQGLGVTTDLSWIELGEERVFREGKTIVESEDKEIKTYTWNEFLETKDFGEEEKKEMKGKLDLSMNKEKMSYLHRAMSNIIICVMPENTVLKKPVKIKNLVKNNSYTHLAIFVGKNTNAEIILDVKSEEESFFTHQTDIIVKENSKVSLIQLKKPAKNSACYSKINPVVLEDSEFRLLICDTNHRLLLQEVFARLKGNNSSARLSNMYLAGKGEEINSYSIAQHEGRNTFSLMQSKGSLASSKAINRGLVRIKENASDSNGYQKLESLMLDEDARSISVPDLEIHNDKVKCTHGATTTRIDEEKVFYMMSRGIPRKKAEEQLVEGFYYPALNEIKDEETKEVLLNTLMERLGEE